MNKYDKKLFESVPNDGTIYELLRSPVKSPFFHFVGILLDNIPWVMDHFEIKGADYLHIRDEGEKAVLIHIDKSINPTQDDVTTAVKQSANKKSFVYKNNKYKFYRKVR